MRAALSFVGCHPIALPSLRATLYTADSNSGAVAEHYHSACVVRGQERPVAVSSGQQRGDSRHPRRNEQRSLSVSGEVK